jgi:transcriptional regulator with XRE-family HTH domain
VADRLTGMAGLSGRVSAHLRAVRRRADLSQRELAVLSGVPLTTIARIEADSRVDPHVSTLSRLVEAAGCRLAIIHDGGEVRPLPDVPELRDRIGRRFPAHLDPQAVRTYLDWWRSSTYKKHPSLPTFTYTTVRRYRDLRRARDREDFIRRYGSNL